MTITNGYADLASFKAWSTITSTDATDDGVIEQCIEAASRYMDDKTGKTFYAATDTKYFNTPEGRTLELNADLLSITTLTNGDDVEIPNTEYILWPYNLPPYSRVILKGSSSYRWSSDSSGDIEQVVSIVGTWGCTATAPDNIKYSTIMIADNLYRLRMGENIAGTTTITAAGVTMAPQTIPSFAADTIRSYLERL